MRSDLNSVVDWKDITWYRRWKVTHRNIGRIEKKKYVLENVHGRRYNTGKELANRKSLQRSPLPFTHLLFLRPFAYNFGRLYYDVGKRADKYIIARDKTNENDTDEIGSENNPIEPTSRRRTWILHYDIVINTIINLFVSYIHIYDCRSFINICGCDETVNF